jgi:hypothetical protein
MDVSKREARKMENQTVAPNMEELEGEDLIQTLVSLTGLPEGMANDEMDQILQLSGHQPEKRSDITLDELRAALIAYLEALEPTCSE